MGGCGRRIRWSTARVELGKLTALRHLQRLRTGYAPSQRRVTAVSALVGAWDAVDAVQSRNLLAHLRRAAEQTQGHLPVELAYLPKQLPEPPAPADLLLTNGAYIGALAAHMEHHGNRALIDEHAQAVAVCAETLLQLRWQAPDVVGTPAGAAALKHTLHLAVQLAHWAGDATNVARWESEVKHLAGRASPPPTSSTGSLLEGWQERSGWQTDDDQPWGFADPWDGIRLAGDAVWLGCGLHFRVKIAG